MDHSFGAFHLMGTPDTRLNMSIDKPVTDHRPIIARVLGVPGNGEKYHGYIEAYMESIFDRDAMFAKIDFVSLHVRTMVSLYGDDAIERFDRMLADEPSVGEGHARPVDLETGGAPPGGRPHCFARERVRGHLSKCAWPCVGVSVQSYSVCSYACGVLVVSQRLHLRSNVELGHPQQHKRRPDGRNTHLCAKGL